MKTAAKMSKHYELKTIYLCCFYYKFRLKTFKVKFKL